ncbi:MAG: ParB/RepB/Spo0J family partition protein [Bdellovibrionales bacterium]|nr:ParB/RepB/Spo0J family partition protein [Bdellovibrionales bacterium]
MDNTARNNPTKRPKRGLGRGLSALISAKPVPVSPVTESAPSEPSPGSHSKEGGAEGVPQSTLPTQESSSLGISERIKYIELSAVVAHENQPRQHFDESEIDELAESIKTLGVLQPVLLRPKKGADGTYEIIAGERRWRAATQAGLSRIPAIVRELDDRETLEVAIVENVQRSNLSPLEEADAYQRLIDEFSLSQREVAEKVGKDRASIANYLRLLKLPKQVRELLADEKISMGHAKAILTVKEPTAQVSLANKVVDEGLSVRALESIVSRVVVLKSNNPPREKKAAPSTEKTSFPDITDRLRKALGTKVRINHHPSGRGRIEVEYFSESELDRIIEKVCG